MTLRGDFEFAVMLWDVADPYLTDEDDARLCAALHTGEAMVAILSIVETLVHADKPVPRRLLADLDAHLAVRVDADPRTFPVMTQVRLRLLVARLQPTDDPCDLGGYGTAPFDPCHPRRCPRRRGVVGSAFACHFPGFVTDSRPKMTDG